VTYEEVCAVMASKSGARTPEQWDDFFSEPFELQQIEARLVKDAVFAQQNGPSVWADLLSYLGVAATVVGDVTGVSTGLKALSEL
jgi:hypothetical protein